MLLRDIFRRKIHRSESLDPERVGADKVPPNTSIVLQSEIGDLERELESAQKKESWHFVWALLGMSPAALIPAIGLLREGSYGLVVLLALLVTITQAYLGVRAGRQVRGLKKALLKLRTGEQSAPPSPCGEFSV